MSRKNINPDQIKSIQASLDDMSGYLTDPSGLVSDDSVESLLSNADVIKTLSKDLMTVVGQFNTYMDGVADAFEQKDIHLSKGISLFDYKVSDQDLATRQSKQYLHSRQKVSDLMDMADNPYYSMLP